MSTKKIITIILALIAAAILVYFLFSLQSVRTILHIQPTPAPLSQSEINAFSDSLKSAASTTAPLSAEQKSQIFQAMKSSSSTSVFSAEQRQKLFQALSSH